MYIIETAIEAAQTPLEEIKMSKVLSGGGGYARWHTASVYSLRYNIVAEQIYAGCVSAWGVWGELLTAVSYTES